MSDDVACGPHRLREERGEARREHEDFSPRDWPAWVWDSSEGRRRWFRGAAFSAFFLLFLAQPIIEAFSQPYSAGLRLVLVADIAVYSIAYVLALWRGPELDRRARILTVAVLAVLGSVIAALFRDPTELTFLSYAIAIALMLWPLRWSRLFGFAIAALQVLLEWRLQGEIEWGNTSTLVLMTVFLGTLFYFINTAGLLRKAREDVAHLAVAEERARLARDLHDVLGHSLTTITVKSGLARRVLESGADRERAIEEVREVEHLARQALSEVRATVSGYRKPSLAGEMVGARAALRAAGITAELPHAVDDVTASLQETFAYVLREGITNVIRHSGAGRCEVRLGATWLEVRDDGAGPGQREYQGHGHGLAGLTDRVAAVGGELTARPLPQGGFVLRAAVPATRARPAAAPSTAVRPA